MDMKYFYFKSPNYQPKEDYQKTMFMMVFDVKQDLRHKYRLVAGRHLIDALHHDIYSMIVKSISVKLLQVIFHETTMEILCGDIGNAYVNAYTNKKVYAIA
mmetsp:Transcript_653/g.1002  ORF Transcript_653/g.1002 Transcript_653/m.1002 type:complete len:101 (-) Transcript_653:21-323(-)